MTRMRMVVMAAGMMLALSAVGCNEDKQKIATLQQENELLKGKNDALQGEISKREQTIADQNTEIARLKSQTPPIGSIPTAPTGPTRTSEWEKGLHGDRVTIDSEVLFASGKATLTESGKSRLDKIAGDLKKSYSGLPVRIYGYTDSDPIQKTKHLWADNLDLSANRAMAVTRYLLTKGVKAELVETIAMGQWHPVGANKTKSRRVEIVVLKKPTAVAMD